MRKSLPYGIIVVAGLLLLSVAVRANIGAVNTTILVWGKSAEDFQMTASLDESNGVLHCWIRNSGTNAIAYNDFEFGYTENVRLEIHQGGKWMPIYSEIVPFHGATGVIYGHIKTLQPGQVITNTWEWRDTLTRELARARRKEYVHDELVKAFHGDTNMVTQAERVSARQTSLSGACQGDTFALDLINTEWPTNMPDTGSIEVRVRQDCHPDKRYDFFHPLHLYSPVITLNSFVIKQFLNRRHWGNT